MKNRSLLICLSLFIWIGMQAKERVIERPTFIAWNSNALEIEKIAQSDTATTFFVKAYFTPGQWIRINKDSYLLGDDGVKYPIRSTDGIPLNQEYFMPESGETNFRMIFTPLPESVSSVDFSEGDVPGAWNIWGIRLKDHTLPKFVLPAQINTHIDKEATLPTPAFTEGIATLKGQLLDYRKGMGDKLSFYNASCISIAPERIAVDLAEDGSFSKEVPVATVTPLILNMNGQILSVYLAPGEESAIYINPRELTRAQSRLRKDEKPEGRIAYYDGYMATVCNELVDASAKVNTQNDYPEIFKRAENKTIEELRTDYLNERAQKLAEVEALNISPACRDILKGNITLSAIERINYIPAIYIRAYFANHKLDEKERNEFYDKTTENIPKDFYDIAYKDFTAINSPAFLYSPYLANIATNPQIRHRLSSATGIDSGLFFELSKTAELTKQIEDFQPASKEQLDEVAGFSSPFFATLIEKKNEDLRKTIEANKKKSGFTVNELGEVSNEDLFASLISKFKGKVILADFWATWCGPCRMANTEMKPMKEELKGEDIVYLYIAGGNSPEKIWNNMIADLPGEHYRISNEQWAYLTETLGIRGVPTYFVINKEGDIAFKTVGFPGVEKIKEELKKQL